jgi:hypothetical protein
MTSLREIKSKPGKRSAKYTAMKRNFKKRLQQKPVSCFDRDEITDLFCQLSSIAYEEGILALEEFEQIISQDEDDRLVGLGLKRATSGLEAEVNTQILEKRSRILLRQQETRHQMLIEGIALLQKRCLPTWIKHQLLAHYTLENEGNLEYLKGSSP